MKPYKGYSAEIELDVEAGVLVGRVLDIDDVVMFESEHAAEVEREFHASVDVYLEVCAEQGKDPQKPRSDPTKTHTSSERRTLIVRATY